MSRDLAGWLEVVDGRPARWAGVLRIDPFVTRNGALFDCLFSPGLRPGPVPLQNEPGFPPDLSDEGRRYLEAWGPPDQLDGFWVDGAKLAAITWAPLMNWPTLDLELWWRTPNGDYELKSRRHSYPSQLTPDELTGLLKGRGTYDKAQYRYVVHPGEMRLELSEQWLCLFTAIRLWVAERPRTRLVGFFF